MADLFIQAFSETLILLPLIFAVHLSYYIIKVTDISVEGSFVLGAATFAALLSAHVLPIIALLLGCCAGAGAGFGVSCIQRYAKVDGLLSGILGLFILYSFNFSVMQQPNISLLTFPSLTYFQSSVHFFNLTFGLAILLALGFITLLYSKLGLLLKAFGINKELLARLGQGKTIYLFTGLMLSNALAAFSGILMAVNNGYADVNMGQGIAVTAIGIVVIGKKLIELFAPSQCNQPLFHILGCVLGGYLYYLFLNLFIHFGVDPLKLKMLLGIVLIGFLATSQIKRKEISYA